MAEPRWLLLAYQLPTRPSNARVKTWRRLQQLGAVPARNSVYVLPNTEQCREDFEWMRSEIVALGGEATVFAADALNQNGADDIVEAFRRAREADYHLVRRAAARLAAATRSKRGGAPRLERSSRAVRMLGQRLADLDQIDFFGAPSRQQAAQAVANLERRVALEPRPSGALSRQSTAGFQNRQWVTRARPGVDRMASAWLIRRFIDANARFAFVDRPSDGDVPFDMYDGEFSHHGSLCTFEVLAETFGLIDAPVARIGQIVHDLDTKETRYAPPEAPAIGRMVEGLRQLHADDLTLLEHGMAMFEALARSFASGGEPRSAQVDKGRRRSQRR